MAWLKRVSIDGPCVVWKTNNIGIRGLVDHHPSQELGTNFFLNRFVTAMVQQNGLNVYDVEPITKGKGLRLTKNGRD